MRVDQAPDKGSGVSLAGGLFARDRIERTAPIHCMVSDPRRAGYSPFARRRPARARWAKGTFARAFGANAKGPTEDVIERNKAVAKFRCRMIELSGGEGTATLTRDNFRVRCYAIRRPARTGWVFAQAG